MIDIEINGKKNNLANAVAEARKDALDQYNKGLKQVQKKVDKKVDEKARKIQALRKEASRMSSLANKRVKRLEKNGLQDSPAYQGYLKSGGDYFSVKGKTYNQLQAEMSRMKTFIDARTSTIKGINSYLKETAKNTGIKYSNLTELRAKAPKFFELTSKVEQYLRSVEDMASAIGYQKIWEAVNTYVKKERIDLASANANIDDMIEEVSKAIVEFEKPENISLKDIGINTNEKWFKLPKD